MAHLNQARDTTTSPRATRRFLHLALLLSAPGLLFGLWSTATVSGRSAFDEMAGVIPLLALVVATPAAVICAVLLVRHARPIRPPARSPRR